MIVLIHQINWLDKMVKVTFAVMLLFLCKSTTARLEGLNEKSSSIGGEKGGSNGGSNSGNSGGDKEKGTSVDVSVEKTQDGGFKASGGISHQGKGWSGEIKGTVNDKGEWSVEGSASVGKRSVDWNGRHYTVRLDPCSFGVYDVNKDGLIVKSEMVAIFGEHTKAEELFEALDLTTGDGRIEEEEFYFMSVVTIDGCQSKEMSRPL